MKRNSLAPHTARGQINDRQTPWPFSALRSQTLGATLFRGQTPAPCGSPSSPTFSLLGPSTRVLQPLTPQKHRNRRRLRRHAAVLGLVRDYGEVGPEALILFLIISLWTPPTSGARALSSVDEPKAGPSHAARHPWPTPSTGYKCCSTPSSFRAASSALHLRHGAGSNL